MLICQRVAGLSQSVKRIIRLLIIQFDDNTESDLLDSESIYYKSSFKIASMFENPQSKSWPGHVNEDGLPNMAGRHPMIGHME